MLASPMANLIMNDVYLRSAWFIPALSNLGASGYELGFETAQMSFLRLSRQRGMITTPRGVLALQVSVNL